MAVKFDVTASTSGLAVTSLTTGSFTITDKLRRAAVIGYSNTNNTITAITGAAGGMTALAIPGTDSGGLNGFVRSLMFGCSRIYSGTQTAKLSWTTACDCVLGVACFYNVDQTTPFNNNWFNGSFTGNASMIVKTRDGEITMVNHATDDNQTVTNQIQLWEVASGTQFQSHGGASYGVAPGTPSRSHTFTSGTNNGWTVSGVNLVAARLATPIGRF